MLLAEPVQPFADSQSQVCGPFGIANIAEVPEAYGTIPGVYGPFGYGLGITTEAAQAHAKAVAAAENVAPLPTDKMLAERLVLAVINLNLATIEEEKQVLQLLPAYGVKQAVVTLAMAAVPAYEDTTTGTTTTTKPVTTTTTDAVKRIETAKKNITAVSKATGIGKTPIYKKWWFWLGFAVVVTGTIYIYTRKPSA